MAFNTVIVTSHVLAYSAFSVSFSPLQHNGSAGSSLLAHGLCCRAALQSSRPPYRTSCSTTASDASKTKTPTVTKATPITAKLRSEHAMREAARRN